MFSGFEQAQSSKFNQGTSLLQLTKDTEPTRDGIRWFSYEAIRKGRMPGPAGWVSHPRTDFDVSWTYRKDDTTQPQLQITHSLSSYEEGQTAATLPRPSSLELLGLEMEKVRNGWQLIRKHKCSSEFQKFQSSHIEAATGTVTIGEI